MLSNKALFLSKFSQNFHRKIRTKRNVEVSFVPDTQIQKVLKVAVIGMPNAGKSTFINNLLDRKVCPASSKVHTTRTSAAAVSTEGDTQIVIVDTPGLVNFQDVKKYNLTNAYIRQTRSSIDYADVIGVIHDVSNSYTREKLNSKVLRVLEKYKKKQSFLVLNKIDLMKSKRKLLDVTRLLTDNCLNGSLLSPEKVKGEAGWKNFSEVFMVSALTGDGLTDIKNYLTKQAIPGKWIYPEKVWTDQAAEKIIVDTVKAVLLNFLPQEMPYSLNVEMEYFDIGEGGIISTVVLVKCPSERILKFVSGEQQGKLRLIIRNVQQDLQNTFRNFVKINIVLQHQEVNKN